MTTHWTALNFGNYLYSVKSDFLIQLERKMEAEKISRKDFAKRLGRTASRVSQIFNGELENFSIEKILEYANALELNVAIVAYEKFGLDPNRGPVPSEIFEQCWERQGRPADFFELNQTSVDTPSETASYFQKARTDTATVIGIAAK